MSNAIWPMDRKAKRRTMRVLEQIYQAEACRSTRRRVNLENTVYRLVPFPPAATIPPKRQYHDMVGTSTKIRQKLGTLEEGVRREGGSWVSDGSARWTSERSVHAWPPTISEFPEHWGRVDLEPRQTVKGGVQKSEPRLRTRDATEDSRRVKRAKKAGFYPECMLTAGVTDAVVPMIPEEELEYGLAHLGFPTTRRPGQYRRELKACPEGDKDFDAWISRFPQMIGELVDTPEKIQKAKSLLYTWKDAFVESIRDMKFTDMMTHRIPTYANVVPKISKPVLYTEEERRWQLENLPAMVDAGVISPCVSPWSARSRFPPKEGVGKLRMVHAFVPLNTVTIKSNYPMKRIEPVLQAVSQPWVSQVFIADATNGYWQSPSLRLIDIRLVLLPH